MTQSVILDTNRQTAKEIPDRHAAVSNRPQLPPWGRHLGETSEMVTMVSTGTESYLKPSVLFFFKKQVTELHLSMSAYKGDPSQ